MDNVFNINRFGNYLLYDLRNARNYFGLSMLICGFFPVLVFVIFEILLKVMFGEWVHAGIPLQISSMAISFFIVFLTFPVKAYGRLTDRKAGSSWLMLPASSFEKWLSMIVITCIVVPVCLSGLMLLSDQVLSISFPNLWASPVLKEMADANASVLELTDGLVSFNFPAILCYEWFTNILCFTLGSLVFKRAKVGKTFLALFVIGTVMGWVCTLTFGLPYFSVGTYSINSSSSADDITSVVRNINTLVNGISVFYAVLVGAGLFWRIKTMKH